MTEKYNEIPSEFAFVYASLICFVTAYTHA